MGKDPFIACEFEMGEIVKILLKDGRGKARLIKETVMDIPPFGLLVGMKKKRLPRCY